MKRRPWPIVILAFFHILSPVGNFFFNAMYVDASYADYLRAYFSPQNFTSSILFFVLPPLAGLAIYLCKKWSFWIYFVIMSIILIHSIFNWSTRSEIGTIVPLVLLFVVNTSIVSYFLIPAVRQIYFDPRLRWWETKPRYSVNYEAKLKFDSQTIEAKVMNLSESGLFAIVNHNVPGDGARIEVSFVDDGTTYTMIGTVIHHQRQGEMGIGIRFIHSADASRSVKFLTKKLDSEGKRITTRDPGPEDSLTSWLKNIFKGPKALFPKIDKK